MLTSQVPREALAMIRYHSFYPWHREGAYRHLMNADDEADLYAVKAFNRMFTLGLSCSPLSTVASSAHYIGPETDIQHTTCTRNPTTHPRSPSSSRTTRP
jgi:hypothetical protein